MSVTIKPDLELDRAVAVAIGERFGEPEPYGLCGPAFAGNTICCRCRQPFSEVGRAAQDFQHCPACRVKWEADKLASGHPPRYSTDLNAAFAAAAKAVEQEWDEGERNWEMSTYLGCDERGWTCSLGCNEHRVFAPTPALAICAAILKLKEKANE